MEYFLYLLEFNLQSMDIFSFAVHFTDEESCILHYKEQRDKEGVICNKCGGKVHYWLKTKLRINANPVMHDKPCVAVRYWKTQIYRS